MKISSPLIVWVFTTLLATASAEPLSITLPAGTEIAIRTVNRIDSKKTDLRTEYLASLDDPIVINVDIGFQRTRTHSCA